MDPLRIWRNKLNLKTNLLSFIHTIESSKERNLNQTEKVNLTKKSCKTGIEKEKLIETLERHEDIKSVPSVLNEKYLRRRFIFAMLMYRRPRLRTTFQFLQFLSFLKRKTNHKKISTCKFVFVHNTVHKRVIKFMTSLVGLNVVILYPKVTNYIMKTMRK